MLQTSVGYKRHRNLFYLVPHPPAAFTGEQVRAQEEEEGTQRCRVAQQQHHHCHFAVTRQAFPCVA